MSSVEYTDSTPINGQLVTHSELVSMAFAGFAHFTAMQVRNRKIKGLGFHLIRLREASLEFFGRALPDRKIRSCMKAAIDDAAFVDSHGRLSEATIWNLVFWDGHAVIWPKASLLQGTMMSIVQKQLSRLNVPQRQEAITLERLGALSGAAVMNSWTPGISVTAIADNTFAQAAPFIEVLHQAFEAEPAISV